MGIVSSNSSNTKIKMGIPFIPDHLRPLEEKVNEFIMRSHYTRNVFIMMRYYEDSDIYTRIEETIKSKLLNDYGLVGFLARDRNISDDLYDNICIYVLACKYGIAVFENIKDIDFNPNISFELGFMRCLDKSCLLLKDKPLKALHTDICGKLYSEFDSDNIVTINRRIDEWMRDLGVEKIDKRASAKTNRDVYVEREELIYNLEDPTQIIQQRKLRIRAIKDGVEGFHVAHFWSGSGPAKLSVHTPGCTLEGPVPIPVDRQLYEVRFEKKLNRSDPPLELDLYYELSDPSKTAKPLLSRRVQNHQLHELVVTVIFDPNNLPANVFFEEYTSHYEYTPIKKEPLNVQQKVTKHIAPATKSHMYVITWS